MLQTLFETLEQLKQQTQCQNVSISLEDESQDEIFIDFYRVKDDTAFDISIACGKDELADLTIDKILDAYFTELDIHLANMEE